jgi:serine/threonine protein phosphatase 1
MSRFLASGGYATVRSLQTTGALLEAIDWAQSLPLMHEDNLRIFVHAGLRPGIPLGEQSEGDLLWIRKPFLDHGDPFPKYVVHGHTPTFLQPGQSRRPDIRPNRCNLDTGAVYGGPLTAAIFSDAEPLSIAIISTD